MDPDGYYFCLRHREVERGVGCRAADRMGPYPTEAAAADWKATADARNDAWREDDDAWEDRERGED